MRLALQLAVENGLVASVEDVLLSAGAGTHTGAGAGGGQKRGPGRPAKQPRPVSGSSTKTKTSKLSGAGLVGGGAASLSALNPAFNKAAWFGDKGRPLKQWTLTPAGQAAYRGEIDSFDPNTGAIIVPGTAIPASYMHTFGVQQILSMYHLVCTLGQNLARLPLEATPDLAGLPGYPARLIGPGLPVASQQVEAWAYTIPTGFDGSGLQPTLQPDACGRLVIQAGPGAGRSTGNTPAAPALSPAELVERLAYQSNIAQLSPGSENDAPATSTNRFSVAQLNPGSGTNAPANTSRFGGVEFEQYRPDPQGAIEAGAAAYYLPYALEHDRATETADVFAAKYYAYCALYNAWVDGLPQADRLPALWLNSGGYPLVLVVTRR